MNVLYSSTRSFYPFLRWSIASLLEHNQVDKLYLLAEDDEVPLDVNCPVEVINYSGQKSFAPDCPNIHTLWNIIPLVYCLIPELVPAEKVIYLDMDTVILEDLRPLWEMDLTGKWGAWCNEAKSTYRPYGEKYYNGGVAVMNLGQMREDRVTETLVRMLNREEFLYSGQDALNAILTEEKVEELPVRYNECFCCGYTDRPAIIHYAGYIDWWYNQSMPRWQYLEKYKRFSI